MADIIDFAAYRSRREAGAPRSEQVSKRPDSGSRSSLGFDISDPKFIGWTVMQNHLASERGEEYPRFRELAQKWRELIGIG